MEIGKFYKHKRIDFFIKIGSKYDVRGEAEYFGKGIHFPTQSLHVYHLTSTNIFKPTDFKEVTQEVFKKALDTFTNEIRGMFF